MRKRLMRTNMCPPPSENATSLTENRLKTDRLCTGPITMRNIFDVMPWSNTVDVVRIPGKALREILEHSVSTYDASHPDPGGRFLQISGLSVTYDTAKPVGDRVRMTAVEATGGDEIADGDLYDVAVSSFLANGGDGVRGSRV